MFKKAILLVLVLVALSCAQDLAWRYLEWDYPSAPTDSITFTAYFSSNPDSGFTILGTTTEHVYELTSHDTLYVPQSWSFIVTAKYTYGESFESAPSNVASEQFKNLPPGQVSNVKTRR